MSQGARKDRQVVVRAVMRPEPDPKKLARALKSIIESDSKRQAKALKQKPKS